MPVARALPKKYTNSILNAQDTLRFLGQRSHNMLLEVEAKKQTPERLQGFLQEVEATVYRLAFELSGIKIAGGCDECPSAPPTTTAKEHLIQLADDLEQKAIQARWCANL